MRSTRLSLWSLSMAVLATARIAGADCVRDSPAGTASDAFVTSTDGTKIAITVFQPAGASAERPVPVVLTVHGWGDSRVKCIDRPYNGGPLSIPLLTVSMLLESGYGVVGIDARGHGDSGGEALVQHPSREISDYRAVIDWIYDHLDWVEKEGEPSRKDIRAGTIGESYGGGFGLMTASFDDRLDAIVPVATWNSLPQSIFPNNVIKGDWLALLYAQGKLTVNMDPRIDQWILESMATNIPVPDWVASFSESSPFYWMRNIRTPALLVQGLPDTVFPINEGVNNYVGIRENLAPSPGAPAPVWLVGVNTGHILPYLQPEGIGAPERTAFDDCGDLAAEVMDFYAAFLKGDGDARQRIEAQARVALATEQGDCVRSADWPPNGSQKTFSFPALVVPDSGGTELLPLFTADQKTTVVGIPKLTAHPPVELDDIFFVSLLLKDAGGIHVVDDQVMAMRTQLASVDTPAALEPVLGGAHPPLEVDLGGVATTLEPGDSLYLRIEGANEQYAPNGSRHPGATVLVDAVLFLPVLE